MHGSAGSVAAKNIYYVVNTIDFFIHYFFLVTWNSMASEAQLEFPESTSLNHQNISEKSLTKKVVLEYQKLKLLNCQ